MYMNCMNIEAWENELFDKYNGEGFDEMEWEADQYDQLEVNNECRN